MQKDRNKLLERKLTLAEKNFLKFKMYLDNLYHLREIENATPSVTVSQSVHDALRGIATGPLIDEILDRACRNSSLADFSVKFLRAASKNSTEAKNR